LRIAGFCGRLRRLESQQQKNETAEASAAPLIEVTNATAIVRELPRFLEATGSLTGDQQTDVAPSIAGKVVAVGVNLGSYVRQGQMIVRLDDVDLKLRVEQAQAQVAQAQAAIQGTREIGLAVMGSRCACF